MNEMVDEFINGLISPGATCLFESNFQTYLGNMCNFFLKE